MSLTPLTRVDPDLAARLPPDIRRRLAPRVGLEVVTLPEGTLETLPDPGEEGLGLLLVEGVLALQIDVAGSSTADLLLPGDVLRGDVGGGTSSVKHRRRLTALAPTAVALLDRRVAMLALRWPMLAAELLARTERRVEDAALRFSCSHVTRIEDRLESLLWQLADRIGTVRPDGIHIDLPVTHEMLGRLVGARRPSVTTALQRLSAEGRLARPDPTRWVLPLASREEVAVQAA